MTIAQSTGAAIAAIGLSLVTLLSHETTIAAQPQPESASTTVRGKVSAVEGVFQMMKDSRGEDRLKMVDKSYVITTPTGQEIHLELTRETKVPTRANPGNRVEAQISDNGQTLSVKLIE